jgi:hypothetical protein
MLLRPLLILKGLSPDGRVIVFISRPPSARILRFVSVRLLLVPLSASLTKRVDCDILIMGRDKSLPILRIEENMDKPNLVGEKFGLLMVIASTKSKHNRSRWICQCECGKNCISTGKTLREGKKKSCGCLRRLSSQEKARSMSKANTLPVGVASMNQMMATYKWQATKRGLEFSISPIEFSELTSQVCFYCGESPKYSYQGASCKTPYCYNGIDRLNNSVGYILSNCVPCCKVCNFMKRTNSLEEFLNKCKQIVDYQLLNKK